MGKITKFTGKGDSLSKMLEIGKQSLNEKQDSLPGVTTSEDVREVWDSFTITKKQC